jgi:type I site-specific restriction endonuclease
MAPAGSKNAPEARAREKIDRLLEDAGWTVQDRDDMNLSVPAVAVREFKLDKGHGYADYLLFLDGKAVGVCEAILAAEIAEDLRSALEQVESVVGDLWQRAATARRS